MTGMGRLISTCWTLLILVIPMASREAAATNLTGRLVFANDRVREFGDITPEMIEALRTEVWLEVNASRPEGAEWHLLSPLEVISARHQVPGISSLAGNKMATIQQLTLGTAPEFVEVGRLYVLVYEGVVRGAWEWVLGRRLKRADEAMKTLTRQTLARKIYVDEFEANLEGARNQSAGLGEETMIPGLEKSRMESYVDKAEIRFDKP
jgi:hypothetical protein